MRISYVNVGCSALLSDWVCLLISTHFPAVVCMRLLSSLWQVFKFFQYISAWHRFISCLLCSFILVRYSVCHYQKHTACLFWFFFLLEKINCLFVLAPVNLLGNPIWDYGKVLLSEMHTSLNDLFNFQLWIWIEFLVRLLWHQVEYFLYILRCALKTLVLYFCFPCRQKSLISSRSKCSKFHDTQRASTVFLSLNCERVILSLAS